jgi:two-component system CheB/CheR fusion protein
MHGDGRSDPTARDGAPGAAPLAVVGIGASAGGLSALQRFVEAVPPDSGMAFVVIMHLDPRHESRIAAILQDRTSLSVTQVTRAVPVQADHVYIIPPGFDLSMESRVIHVHERGPGHHVPVDRFFRTLADAWGTDAVGVVLSGTGSDGTEGVRAVRERGGITVAQEPAEAEYDSMPASAIATGSVDLVLPAARIPGELLRLRSIPSAFAAGDAAGQPAEALLGRLFAAVQAATGHDFSLYKRPTVLRRLDRRLRFNGVSSVEEYLPLLGAGSAEPAALVRDLLISVSGFFRDADAFAALEEAVPGLFADKGPDDAVRVWVVGCATGEEAYSISILLHEHAATLESPPQIQVFATDIDEQGYAWGREALYPASAVAAVPAERLRRWFTREPGGYRVNKALREGVLFALHNVLHDPPFSRLDLVSCRNLLIYLQPQAQQQVVETVHYALRAGGLLFLGGSESADASGLFVPANGPRRLYRRNGAPHRVPQRLSTADPPRARGARGDGGAQSPPFAYGPLHLRMLEEYAPPSVVVNERLEVVHLSGGAGRYLHLGQGEPTRDVLALVRGALRTELRVALYQAFEKGISTTRRVPGGRGGRGVILRVHPPVDGVEGARFALVVLNRAPRSRAPANGAAPDGTEALAEELRLARDQLELAGAERDRTVEALRTANQELRSINEEQKAGAEELETSREEVQSVNEELTSINQEHQATIEEQRRTNADLQNLIGATGIGTIFLDRALRVRRFTPAAEGLFNFVDTDLGRPLAHITHRLRYPALVEDAHRVLTLLERIEREVTGDDGAWYIVRISPYRSPDGDVDGVVLTFFDITARKRVEEELRQARLVAESANLAKTAFLATLSHEFRTPLGAMLLYADLLALDGQLTPEQARTVDHIKTGGAHLASMIDEILAFAVPDEQAVRVRVERMDAREIVRASSVLVEPVATAKHLGFVLELPDEPVELETDRDKACQVVVNLCGNAVKYTERGEVRLAVRSEGGRVVFEVRDTGIGIAPENQGRIFDRFWQVDETAGFGGGLGIGLAVAREFTRLLGGDVEVESEPGVGSTFRVWLPRTRRGG